MKFSIDNIIKILIGILAVGVGLFLWYSYSTLVAYFIVAVLFSYVLDPLVSHMESSGMNRTMATIIAMTSVFLVMGWFVGSVLEVVTNQVVALGNQLNEDTIRNVAEKVIAQVKTSFPFIPEEVYPKDLKAMPGDYLNFGDLQNTLSSAGGLFANVFTAVLIIPITTFFLVKEGSSFRRGALALVPNRYFETVLSIISKIERRLGLYFKSIGLQSLAVGLLSGILLSSVGLKNAVAVAVVIGFANVIPYFGPIIGYILSIIVAVFETGDFTLVFWSLGAVFFTQIVDNVVLQPLIFSKSADMHPVAILFVVMVGAQTAGVVGMLVAIPIATIVKITVREISWSLKNYHVFKFRG